MLKHYGILYTEIIVILGLVIRLQYNKQTLSVILLWNPIATFQITLGDWSFIVEMKDINLTRRKDLVRERPESVYRQSW